MERNLTVNKLIIDITLILLLLSLAKIFEAFLRYIHIEPFISWFIAGIILNIVVGNNISTQYFENIIKFTAILIVFLMGLSTDVEFLKHRARNSIIIGIFGISLTFILTFIVLHIIIRISLSLSLILSIILSNTASEIVSVATKATSHLDVKDYAIGASIFDDILAIVFTSIYLMLTNPIKIINSAMIGIPIFIAIITLIYVFSRIYIVVRKEFLTSIFIALLFISTAIAIYIEFSEILIAFLLGLSIKYVSRGHDHLLRYASIVSELRDDLEKILNIFFLPILFASIGLMINISSININNIIMLALAMSVGKFLGCSIPSYYIVRDRLKSIELGIIMNLRGFLENTLILTLFIHGYMDIAFYSTIAITPIIVTLATLVVIQIIKFYS